MKINVRDLEYLSRLVIRSGCSKVEFASKIGVSPALFGQISNGIRSPSPRTAKRIADELLVGWDELFTTQRRGDV